MNSQPDKPVLRLDWCSHEAAKYAVEHWHYSKSLPGGRNVFCGVWESGRYIGAVVFGIGSGNATNGTRYGLKRSHEMAELVRVALAKHTAPVSRIVSIAIRFLAQQSPGIRLIISMADPAHGHVGKIYQAGNWIYTGETKPDVQYQLRGKWVHHRTATSSGSAAGLPSRPLPGKHRYLMPLDAEMRERILPLAKPYPKRAGSNTKDAPADQAGEGGSTPTPALHPESVTHALDPH
jgi:hypothetical protein